jgi:acetyl-CoA carboxylase / biotin carboxylase 1
MEAKGCAKPAIWKDARRYFYWATRARLARSNALAQLAAACPSKSRQFYEQLLNDLSGVTGESEHQAVVQALENLDLSSAVAQLKCEHLVQNLLGDRANLVDGLVRLVDSLTQEERATVLAALKNRDASPGPSDLCILFGYLTNSCVVL